ncbi:MAG: hypothetical protein U0354_00320 [Candidatus Sericytochromatia bacterium]
MLGAIKNIINIINTDAANLAGANINGYKKKTANMASSGDGADSIGNDLYTKTDYSQGALEPTGDSSDLALQGRGFFVLFDDTALASFDANKTIQTLNGENTFTSPITSGSFTVNGTPISVNTATDTFNDVLNRIGTATGGVITAQYDPVQNAVTLTNNSGTSGATVTVANGTSNFISASQLDQSVTQPGPFNLNYITSANPVGSVRSFQKTYLTRDGDFNFNSDGFLVNSRGLYVAGLEAGTGRLTKIDKKTFQGGGDADDEINFTPNGILFNISQGVKAGKQIALADVPNPQALASSNKGSGLFEITSNTGAIKFGTPDSDGFGLVKDQNVERSNSDPVESLTNLGIMQKFFPSTISALKVTLGVQDDLNKMV